MDHKGLLMTDIIIHNEPNDYYDVFQTDLFTRPTTTGRPLNFLEKMDRSRIKQQEEEEEETDD